MDFREGGIWHYEMVGPQDEMTGSSVITTFHEITPPTRIVMSDYFVDADGAATMEIYGSTKTIVLADRGTQTELTLTAAYPTAEGLQGVLAMGMVEGMGIALDQLHAYVEAQ
jgi:uncharacterized protein YndB with AHSA1/START domain